jgi:glutaredoxin
VAGGARVVVYTRVGCHLCTDAVAVAAGICEREGVALSILDVDSDPRLKAAYTDHVPVTVVDGEVLSYWFLDTGELLAALRRRRPT